MDESEIADLERQFGPLVRRTCHLDVSESSFNYWQRVLNDKRGEVVMAIQRPGGRLLLHTKRFYPPGIYRLPTGGVRWSEEVVDALNRELAEETGLAASLERCLGIIVYRFHHTGHELPFVSYVFLLRAFHGHPAPRDAGEEIVAFRSMPAGALRQVIQALQALPAEWIDWGRFRALAHDLVATELGV
jgi:ADP-ribose pyrophosphatase YjhB (NUDIX family)